MARGKLTAKQKMFVDEYVVDFNATQACIRAGYSAKTADRIGPLLVGKNWVAKAIQEKQQKRVAKLEITAEKVIAELAKIAFQDVRELYREDGSLIPIRELSESAAAMIAGIDTMERSDDSGDTKVTKIKLADKRQALVDIGRHLGLFVDRLESKTEAQIRIIGGLPGWDTGTGEVVDAEESSQNQLEAKD